MKVTKSTSIAFLGPHGTFTEDAAKQYASKRHKLYELKSQDTIFDCIQCVATAAVDKAVVPIENTIQGAILTTLDFLVINNVLIEEEIDIPIVQHLLALQGTTINAITDIISHPQALAQCEHYLRSQRPNIRIHLASSTAEAAAIVSKKGNPAWAAIGNKRAAALYNLVVLASQIEDNKRNVTRFVVIGSENTPPSGFDKTSIVFSLPKDLPGGLYGILREFADRSINLPKIESRPTKQAIGEYFYFVDLQGHVVEKNIYNALQAVKEKAAFYKLLGAYPTAVNTLSDAF